MSAEERPRRSFPVHVAWTLAARLLMAANSVAVGLIVARWLGPDDLGVFSVLSVTIALAMQIGSAGLPAANTYFIAQDRRRLAPAFVNALFFALVVGSTLALGVVLSAAFAPALFGYIPIRLIALAAVAIPFHIITLICLNIFLGVGRVGQFNLLEIVWQSFGIINAALALIVLAVGLWTLVFLNTAASIVVSILVAWLLRRYIVGREVALKWLPDVSLLRRMLGYSIKFHVTWIMTMLIYRADLLIVNFFRGAAEAGVYAVATQGSLLLMLLPSATAHLLIARIASSKDARELTCTVARHIAFVMLIVCLAAVPASLLFPVFYGAAFADATIQLLILLPGIYLIGIQSVLVQHFVSTGAPTAIPLFWIATLLLNVALNLMLVPVYGARGAAFVSSVSYTVIFALVFFYFLASTGASLSATLVLKREELRELFSVRRFLAASERA